MRLLRPLIFFDLETTGTNTATDRIVQIGAIKFLSSGERIEKNYLINPGYPTLLKSSDKKTYSLLQVGTRHYCRMNQDGRGHEGWVE